MYLLISKDSCSKISGRDLSLYILLLGYLNLLLFLPLYLWISSEQNLQFPYNCIKQEKEIVMCMCTVLVGQTH